jgi:hypothetical protein
MIPKASTTNLATYNDTKKITYANDIKQIKYFKINDRKQMRVLESK